MTKTDARIVLVTAGSESAAAELAQNLVEERLAACVNIVGSIRSIYRWHDKIEDEPEALMIVKTRAPLLEALERRIAQLHQYEVPEMLVLSIDSGAQPYLGWLGESLAH